MTEFSYGKSINFYLSLTLFLTSISFGFSALADDKTAIEKLSVFGKKESLPTRPGSAHVLDEEELQNFELNDIHRILRSVPGVNIQEEDGFGLRPNIGLRGAHPHRSKSITIMEDGVLIAPAPYAAPAAYYFPQIDKMSSIEVFKGVPSTKFGPNSIGGALNLVTRSNNPGAQLGLSRGGFGFEKYDASLGVESFGDFSLDATRISSTGFKTFGGSNTRGSFIKDQASFGNDTGFVRQNVTFRWDKYIAPMDQNLTLKVNWSDEESDETYTGLSRDDFIQNPYHRYASTALDKMKWEHNQVFVNHSISPIENLRIKTTGYYHQLHRSWFKLNGFNTQASVTPPSMTEILKNPTFSSNEPFYEVISGQRNSGSLSGNRDVLDIGDNNRKFYSRGAQVQLSYELDGFAPSHLFELSYRRHGDGVQRHHSSSFFNMVDGSLQENQSLSILDTAINESLAEANTIVFSYESQWEKLNYSGVVRFEDIDYTQKNHLTNTEQKSSDHVVAPGLGVYYQFLPTLGALAGVNKGFTPVGPGQTDDIKPEESTNYEMGLRYSGWFGAELIGFYSDYKNLLGTCTLSNGCAPSQVGTSFNGGTARVRGLEFIASKEFQMESYQIPLRWSATFTEADFQNTFTSGLNEWGIGEIRKGDPLPYIPRWQSTLTVGLNHKNFFSNLNFNYLSRVYDQAVQLDRITINERMITDLVLGYNFSANTTLRFRVDNLTDEKYVVSLQPFGQRPGMPRNYIVGVTHAFR